MKRKSTDEEEHEQLKRPRLPSPPALAQPTTTIEVNKKNLLLPPPGVWPLYHIVRPVNNDSSIDVDMSQAIWTGFFETQPAEYVLAQLMFSVTCKHAWVTRPAASINQRLRQMAFTLQEGLCGLGESMRLRNPHHTFDFNVILQLPRCNPFNVAAFFGGTHDLMGMAMGMASDQILPAPTEPTTTLYARLLIPSDETARSHIFEKTLMALSIAGGRTRLTIEDWTLLLAKTDDWNTPELLLLLDNEKPSDVTYVYGKQFVELLVFFIKVALGTGNVEFARYHLDLMRSGEIAPLFGIEHAIGTVSAPPLWSAMRFGSSALMHAIFSGSLECVKFVVENMDDTPQFLGPGVATNNFTRVDHLAAVFCPHLPRGIRSTATFQAKGEALAAYLGPMVPHDDFDTPFRQVMWPSRQHTHSVFIKNALFHCHPGIFPLLPFVGNTKVYAEAIEAYLLGRIAITPQSDEFLCRLWDAHPLPLTASRWKVILYSRCAPLIAKFASLPYQSMIPEECNKLWYFKRFTARYRRLKEFITDDIMLSIIKRYLEPSQDGDHRNSEIISAAKNTLSKGFLQAQFLKCTLHAFEKNWFNLGEYVEWVLNHKSILDTPRMATLAATLFNHTHMLGFYEMRQLPAIISNLDRIVPTLYIKPTDVFKREVFITRYYEHHLLLFKLCYANGIPLSKLPEPLHHLIDPTIPRPSSLITQYPNTYESLRMERGFFWSTSDGSEDHFSS